ncbi:hypothetical protein Tco_0881529 [Tanacetum coccineum]
MANLSEDVQCAGSDTRPPMLDKTDFASWQQCIRLYCRGTENGDEKDRYNADIRATNIILQGLPKDIYSLINHYTDAKDIWDNLKMLLEGSELTKEDRESQLFAKLINDMRNIKMTMSKIQLNRKFVNNMLPEWGRFVTTVKLNKGLKDSNIDQLYAYLKQHEAHANENKMMLERLTQQTVDPLSLMSNVSAQHYHSQSSTIPPTTYHQPHSNVQGRQNQNQRYFARGNGTAGNGGAQNRAGNANPKRLQNSDYFKEQEAVDAKPKGNGGLANPQAGPSNASILSEVHILENAIDHSISNQDEYEVHNKVQLSDVIDTTSVHMGNSNVTPYEQ